MSLLRELDIENSLTAWVGTEVTDFLKFAELLPQKLAKSIVAERFSDREAAQEVLATPITTVQP